MKFGLQLYFASAVLAVWGISDVSAATIGLNIGKSDVSTSLLSSADVAGVPGYAQAYWNAVNNASGSITSGLLDSTGAVVSGLSVTWTSYTYNGWSGIYAGTSNWGFSGSDFKLMSGLFIPNSTVTIKDIPYDQYDIIVYFFSSSASGGKGSISLNMDGSTVETDYFNFGWTGNNVYRESSASSAETATTAGNYLVIHNLTASDIQLYTANMSGAMVGISAIQIVDTTLVPEPASLAVIFPGLLLLMRRK